jgi:hypothetical protein
MALWMTAMHRYGWHVFFAGHVPDVAEVVCGVLCDGLHIGGCWLSLVIFLL